jgi:hypothetical protein
VIGATLVSYVLDRWRHLPERQYRALLCMAVVALDKTSKDGKAPGLYFGGHERIARTWRQPYPDDDTDEARKRREDILHEVRKTCRALREAKAIEIVDTGEPVRDGQAQTYRLTL